MVTIQICIDIYYPIKWLDTVLYTLDNEKSLNGFSKKKFCASHKTRVIPDANCLFSHFSSVLRMEEAKTNSLYSIDINKKKYIFTCPDGEEHVLELKEKLTKTIESVSGQEPGYVLSDYAMKIALLLADEAISEKKRSLYVQEEIEQKVSPLLHELDKVLNIED